MCSANGFKNLQTGASCHEEYKLDVSQQKSAELSRKIADFNSSNCSSKKSRIQ